MSVLAMQSVASRVGEIRTQINRIVPQGRSFAETLQAARTSAEPAAQSSVDAPAEGFLVATAATPRSTAGWASPPIGMLGTPVVIAGGLAAGSAWTEQLPEAAAQWIPTIERAAADVGLDPRLLAAMVWQESRFDAGAVSRSGALGLAQLMPATAEGLGVDPHDPVANLEGGARYLAWTIDEFGSIELGLAAYNAGPGNVRAAGGIPDIPETQAYVPRVIEYYRQLGGVA